MGRPTFIRFRSKIACCTLHSRSPGLGVFVFLKFSFYFFAMIIMKCSLRSFAATLLATATLLLALPSHNLLAQTECVATPFAGGEGTSDTPYQVSSITHLNAIRDNSGDDPTGCNYLAKHFVLTKDLDFEDTDGSGAAYVYSDADQAENAKGWLPIGHDTDKDTFDFQGTRFTGTFDGGGDVIRNLSISRSDEDYVGLFGGIGLGGSVKNLGLENLDVNGRENTGGLAGITSGGNASLSSCYTAGSVSGAHKIGGLVGQTFGPITLCYSSARVTGTRSAVGGLVGNARGILSSSYSVGDVTGSSQVGGFVGSAGNSSSIRSCYSAGSVTGTFFKVGGFIGAAAETTLTSCYSTGDADGLNMVGGFLGESVNSSVTSCYSTGTATASQPASGGFVGQTSGSTFEDTYWENAGTAIDDATDDTDRTQEELKALDADDFGTSSGLSWDFGTSDQYPAIRTYKEMPADTQVQGDVISGQPCPRVLCYFVGGAGTDEDPYQISSVGGLNDIRGDFLDDHFVLMNNMDLDDYMYSTDMDKNVKGWLPIGHDTDKEMDGFQGMSFSGTFDGKGHVISGLYIRRSDESYLGFFGHLTGSVTHLGVVGMDIEGESTVGGIGGECADCTISSSYSTGRINSRQAGGLLGLATRATIMSCYSTVDVTGSEEVGGLGGIFSSATMSSSYSTGVVTEEGSIVGGLGDLIASSITSSYWENAGTAIDDATDDTDRTQEELKALTTFEANDSDWDFGDATQYPALKRGDSVVEGQPCPRVGCLFGGGVGSQTDPYQIFTKGQLNDIRGDFLDDHYILMNDLDFDDHTYANVAKGWLPIGDATTPFSGSFDGGGNVIRNLFINRGEARVGLFRQLGATGSLEGLGVEDVAVEGNQFAGGLVGETLESATITLCHATGVVTSRSENAGVLVGKNSGTITLCHATGTATGPSATGILVGENATSGTVRSSHSAGSAESSGSNAGGLVGRNVRGTITSCYSTGRAEVSRGAAVGGLVGFSNAGTIKWCYATGTATVRFEGVAGGLVGESFGTKITSCYSTGATQTNGTPAEGLVGSGGTVLNSFWDTDTSGITTTGKGTGKTTAEMKALTLEMLGDSGGLSWDVGNENQYPAVRSYKDDGGSPAAQVAGDVLVGQPCPRAGVCNVFVGGTGTEDDPYQISSVKQLDAIRGDFLDDHFVLVNDLDFDGYVYSENAKGWLPIGHDTDKDTGGFQGTAFSGSFDGGGYVIRNLFISRADEDYVGLFGLLLTGSFLKNLGVKGVAVEADERVGGLVGELSGWLGSCYATGQVTGMVSVGGLLGYNDQGTVTSCYSTVSATSRGAKPGGLWDITKGKSPPATRRGGDDHLL